MRSKAPAVVRVVGESVLHAVALGGVASITWGVYLYSEAAGWIVGGALAVAVTFFWQLALRPSGSG